MCACLQISPNAFVAGSTYMYTYMQVRLCPLTQNQHIESGIAKPHTKVKPPSKGILTKPLPKVKAPHSVWFHENIP